TRPSVAVSARPRAIRMRALWSFRARGFPYPTLFRSHRSGLRFEAEVLPQADLLSLLRGNAQHRRDDLDGEERREFGHNIELCWVDRKSTRLNSNHVSISYAVFCLKKKKLRKQNCHKS